MTNENKTQVEKREFIPAEEQIEAMLRAQDNPDTVRINEYLCEVCGKVDNLTEYDAWNAGWDYPPFMGWWGILSPRTCPNCTMKNTAYWYILTHPVSTLDDVPEKHRETILRIKNEVNQ